MTFHAEGQCVRVSDQTNTSQSAYIETFPIEERHGIVWIWMGDRELANVDTIFDMPEFTAGGWHAHHGDGLHIEANYLNVDENLVDPAHVNFVHPTTLGSAASEDVPVHVSTSGDVISAWRWIRDSAPVGFSRSSAVSPATSMALL